MTSRFRFAAFALVTSSALTAYAGDFMDTRIVFTLSDDNVLQGPTNTNPASPTAPNMVGGRNNVQFYDNYDTRFTGFETLTHLAMYKKMPSFFGKVDTEAGLVLRALVRDDASVQLGDAGSFLRVVFPIGDNKDKQNFNIVAFPVSSDRMRLGYSYAISWGGNPMFPGQGLIPGIKLGVQQPIWNAYVGAKTGVRQRRQVDGSLEQDTVWGVLGGAAIDFTDTLTFEVNGGYFDRGSIDKEQFRRNPVTLQGFGGSAQLSFHRGLPIGTSIDFQLYRNDPDMPARFFSPEIYDDSFSFVMKSEFSVLGQPLQDIDAPNTTKIQLAYAGDLNFSAKYKKFRFTADAVFRSLSFILFNVPSSPSYNDFPRGTQAFPEVFASAGIDYFFANAHLTPGLKVGVQLPSHYVGTPNAGSVPGASLASQQTIVYYDSIDISILDQNLRVLPVIATTASLKWDISELIGAALQVLAKYDANRTTLRQDPNGVTLTRTLLQPFGLGFNLILQARF